MLEFCESWPITWGENGSKVVSTGWSAVTVTTGQVLWVFGVCYIVFFTILYAILRPRSAYLRRRGSTLVFITSVGLLPLLHGLEYREIYGRENYPCLLFLFTQVITFPCFITPYAVRAYILYQRYMYKRMQVSYWEETNGHGLKEGHRPSFGTLRNVQPCTVTQVKLAMLQYRSTERYGCKLLLAFAAVALLLYALMVLPRPNKYGINCRGCDDDLSEMAILTLLDVFLSSASLWALYKVKDEKDPLEILSELKWSFYFNMLIVQPSLLLHVVDPGSVQREGRWEWGHVIVVGLLGMYSCTIPLQIYKSYARDRK